MTCENGNTKEWIEEEPDISAEFKAVNDRISGEFLERVKSCQAKEVDIKDDVFNK